MTQDSNKTEFVKKRDKRESVEKIKRRAQTGIIEKIKKIERKKKRNDLINYCKLIKKHVKKISKDEILTAKLYEKIIKKWNIKKAKFCYIPTDQYNHTSSYFFNTHYKKYEPVIIKNLSKEIGNCIQNFNDKNIIKYIGDNKVSIHVSNSKFLNNVNKNFRYELSSIKNFISLISKEEDKKQNFTIKNKNKNIYIQFKKENSNNSKKCNVLVKECDPSKIQVSPTVVRHFENIRNEKEKKNENAPEEKNETSYTQLQEEEDRKYYYYRSLGKNQFKEVSDIKKMNNYIEKNFYLPTSIYPCFTNFEFFSSILRIGQNNIFIWLHYDTPDNFLIQIKGRKKILLIPPQFINYFNIIDSSSSYNLFHILTKEKLSEKEKVIKKILIKYSIVADLFEGDILFIPSLWLHYIFNMPEHTFVSKKFKHLHKYIKLERKPKNKMKYEENNLEQESEKGHREMKRKKKKIKRACTFKTSESLEMKENIHSSFYVNTKIMKAINNRKCKKLFFFKKRRKRIVFLFQKDKKQIYEKEIQNKPSGSYNTFRCNEEETLEIKKCDFAKDELIKHYSHMNKYEQFLKKNFNISIHEQRNEATSLCEKVDIKEQNQIKAKKELLIKEYNDMQNPEKNLHNACFDTKLNISINYFFRKKEEKSLFNKKDLYGNQDIIAASHILQKIQKEIKPILDFPKKYKNFYLQKIQGIFFSQLDDDYVY